MHNKFEKSADSALHTDPLLIGTWVQHTLALHYTHLI